MLEEFQIELLSKKHDSGAFDCGGHESLNIWLKRHALQSQSNDSARTYVLHRRNVVCGYYAICAASIERDRATLRAAQGQASHPVPLSLIGRLAIDRHEQGKGFGSALLKDALVRIERAAEIIGIRAVLVHAIDEAARDFYERFDFERCPGDDLHLMLLMKDLRKSLLVR
ncbi:GNAT family N-acetyltransferase [Edaphobacter bradus]|uniref:GNAT family N-acetyltransferase n=1 Tax=Edaphobacter bradus TaxID=2259016 RepID=UPI0021E06595|nr:GNAT family N-acetyltransferase [Edaphobacter bradus]